MEVNEVLYVECICDACHLFLLGSGPSPKNRFSAALSCRRLGAEPGPNAEGSKPRMGPQLWLVIELGKKQCQPLLLSL